VGREGVRGGVCHVVVRVVVGVCEVATRSRWLI
jgi:hypothetical protein